MKSYLQWHAEPSRPLERANGPKAGEVGREAVPGFATAKLHEPRGCERDHAHNIHDSHNAVGPGRGLPPHGGLRRSDSAGAAWAPLGRDEAVPCSTGAGETRLPRPSTPAKAGVAEYPTLGWGVPMEDSAYGLIVYTDAARLGWRAVSPRRDSRAEGDAAAMVGRDPAPTPGTHGGTNCGVRGGVAINGAARTDS